MRIILFLSVFVVSTQLRSYCQLPAFPGAEGFGAYSAGGRAGKVVFVDNLNDDGNGSLRAAINESVPLTVIFRISGTIELKSALIINKPFITIAGQTAPGDGICLKNYVLQIRNTHDVIIRCIRVRPGIESGKATDAIEIRNSKNIILDHCSASWSTDEILNTWHNTENITVQWCIFSEPLNKSIHKKGAHGYAASIGSRRGTYHHNLFANAAGRNPSIAGDDKEKTERFEFINNVVFNWEHRACDGKPVSINFMANYYKPGPATQSELRNRLVKIDNSQKYGFQSKWYISGNAIEGYPEILADNWSGAVGFEEGTNATLNKSNKAFEGSGFVYENPATAYQKVLAEAGALVPRRDAVDLRIIEEVKSGKPTFGNGIPDKVEQTGSWSLLKSSVSPADSDLDGMPDVWEKKNGLNPKNSADGNEDKNGNGYTNLEEYLNELMKIKP